MDGFLQEPDLEELFKKAADYVKSVVGKLDSNKLLYLYARFKQANEGPCQTTKPGFFDFQGKQKWEAWKKLGSMTKSQAMSEYISAVSVYDSDWEEKMDSGLIKPKAGMGVAVSTMGNRDDDLADDKKTIFDWCKEGNTNKVSSLLSRRNGASEATKVDENGMTMLHWSADRGYTDMTQLLLKLHCDVNAQDADGQTALHYAVTCEHPDVVSGLLKHGADIQIADVDGMTALDIAEDSTIKQLLQQS